jgi:hypothetical protein
MFIIIIIIITIVITQNDDDHYHYHQHHQPFDSIVISLVINYRLVYVVRPGCIAYLSTIPKSPHLCMKFYSVGTSSSHKGEKISFVKIVHFVTLKCAS